VAAPDTIRNLVSNRKAGFEYHLEDRYEAGIELRGSEVKSLRAGNANLQEAWVRLDKGSAWLVGCHISHYDKANRNNHEPLAERRLLLNAQEIAKLKKAITIKGKTIVPVRIYLKGSWVKIEIAIAVGKKLHDKRATQKDRDAKREVREFR
jgi:SsrA-binding protein